MPLHEPTFCIRFIHKEVRLPIDEAHMIMPAYAITVHKSQGSEYGVVIIPFVPRYGGMLQRNLLYTAVTRAKRKVIIVGTTSAVERAVRTVNADERYTLFKERLQGRCDFLNESLGISYFHLFVLTVVRL